MRGGGGGCEMEGWGVRRGSSTNPVTELLQRGMGEEWGC